jgi:hypothetical protein
MNMYYLLTEDEVKRIGKGKMGLKRALAPEKKALLTWSVDDLKEMLPDCTEAELHQIINMLEEGSDVGTVLKIAVDEILRDRKGE